MPDLYIIAGCNGAGKTTAAFTLLPEIFHCSEFVNADLIAAGISPFAPEGVAILSGRIMSDRLQHLLTRQENFAFETTLATRSFTKIIEAAKSKNYKVSLIFFQLNTIALAFERVKHRVANGGHNIPPDIIQRRFERGIENFTRLYKPIVDAWILVDNSYGISQIEKHNDPELFICMQKGLHLANLRLFKDAAAADLSLVISDTDKKPITRSADLLFQKLMK